jgi:hypothetical protein
MIAKFTPVLLTLRNFANDGMGAHIGPVWLGDGKRAELAG